MGVLPSRPIEQEIVIRPPEINPRRQIRRQPSQRRSTALSTCSKDGEDCGEPPIEARKRELAKKDEAASPRRGGAVQPPYRCYSLHGPFGPCGID
jgi:hypothetical protein